MNALEIARIIKKIIESDSQILEVNILEQKGVPVRIFALFVTFKDSTEVLLEVKENL